MLTAGNFPVVKQETPAQRIAANVRAEAARFGASQSVLADALKLSQAGISRRLSGKVDFSASELSKLAEFLDVPVSTFFGEGAAA